MEIRNLRYLIASARAGNFGRAPKLLGLNTSTISRRIGRSEDELGLTLFQRGRSGVQLTAGGRAVLPHVVRALAELDRVERSAAQNGSGSIGKIRFGVRMPPIGEPLRGLLTQWHKQHPHVLLTISEMEERETARSLKERRLDAALVTGHTLWPHATAMPIYRERITVALPREHPWAARDEVDWLSLRDETFLVQGRDDSQSAREFYASFLGSEVRFRAHPASKQSVFALVGAGYRTTLATKSQSEVTFPSVIYTNQ